MSEVMYANVNTLLRIKESEFLTRDIFDSLLKAKSFEHVLQILKNTKYHTLSQQYQDELLEHLKLVYQEVIEALPNQQIVELFSLSYTYHNLKVLLKASLANLSISDLVIDIGTVSVTSLQHLVYTKEHENSCLVEAVTETIAHYEEFEQIEAIDILLDRFYFKHLITIARAIQDDNLLKMVRAWIDLYNVNCVLRLGRRTISRSFLMSVLSEYGAISIDELVESALRQSHDQLFSLLKVQDYFDSVAHCVLSDNMSSFIIEKAKDDVAHYYLSQAIFEPFGFLPTLAFLYYSEMEIKNLRLILTGKANGFDFDQLQERMRPIYEL